MTVFSLDLHPADGLADLVDHTTGDTVATLRLGQSPFGEVEVVNPEAWEAFKAGGDVVADLLDALRLNVVDPSQAPDLVVRLAYDLRRLERQMVMLEGQMDGVMTDTLVDFGRQLDKAKKGVKAVNTRVTALEKAKEEAERIKQRVAQAEQRMIEAHLEEMRAIEGGEG